jgi:uncharacterized membrane protein
METGYWWGPMFGMPWIMPFLCFLVMAVVAFMVFRRAGGCCSHFGPGARFPGNQVGETPRQILDRRLASGEITRQEYEEMRLRIEAQ